jgi:hypothetical protein
MMLAASDSAVATDATAAHTSTTSTQQPAEPTTAEDAASRVYDAEVNLHHARQSCIDDWISAAYDHLHLALQAHARACS